MEYIDTSPKSLGIAAIFFVVFVLGFKYMTDKSSDSSKEENINPLYIYGSALILSVLLLVGLKQFTKSSSLMTEPYYS